MAKKLKQAPAMSPATATSNEEVEEFNEAAMAEEAPVGDELPPVVEPAHFDEPLQFASDVVARPDIPSDPKATIASALLAIGHLYNDAKTVSSALAHHMSMSVANVELHAVMSRMNVALGDFCHSFDQIHQQMSEELTEAIQDALT